MRAPPYWRTVYRQGTLPAVCHKWHRSTCDHTRGEHSPQLNPCTPCTEMLTQQLHREARETRSRGANGTKGVNNWRAQKQSGLTHKCWLSSPNLENMFKMYIMSYRKIEFFWKFWQLGRVQCMVFIELFRQFPTFSSELAPPCFWALQLISWLANLPWSPSSISFCSITVQRVYVHEQKPIYRRTFNEQYTQCKHKLDNYSSSIIPPSLSTFLFLPCCPQSLHSLCEFLLFYTSFEINAVFLENNF